MPYADPIIRKQKGREAYLRRIQDPEYVRRMNEQQSARAKLPEVQKQLKAAHKRRWERPAYREKVLTQNKAWAEAHPENSRKRSLKWRHKNVEKARRIYKEWAKNNPDKTRELSNRRRARMVSATVNPKSIALFISGTKSKRFATCYYCKEKVSTDNIHFDHIQPLSRGGAHSVENLCVACVRCNLTKSAKRLQDFVTLGQQLLEL